MIDIDCERCQPRGGARHYTYTIEGITLTIPFKRQFVKEIPLPFSANNKYNGRITVRTPKILHRELIEKAEEEGISLNQYLVYLLSKGVNDGTHLRK